MKFCATCKEEIHGRADKKYCSDQCRYLSNNKKKANYYKDIHRINRILKQNRNILKYFCPQGLGHLRKQVLLEKGYNFRYFTSYYKSGAGNVYFLVYDYGFMMIDHDKVRIISKQDYMSTHSSKSIPVL